MIHNKTYCSALERSLNRIAIRDGRILVTGASGLIGSCLIDLLMTANNYGRSFEIFAMGRSLQKLRNRFSYYKNPSQLHYLVQDVKEPLKCELELDYIVHGASNADPRKYSLFPIETMLTNIYGANNILEYCVNHPHTKVILLSSFEVYGNGGKDVYNEEDAGVVDLNSIRSCYPESKRFVEVLSKSYVNEYGVNTVIGRLCSIYGPTQTKDDSKAHAQFLRNAINGDNIVLKSKGNQRRTYCYVIDAVTGILHALEKGLPGESYNISYEKSIASISEVAQTIAKISGTHVIYGNPDAIESKGYSKPQNCILDNTKLRLIGWNGHYSLEEGIKETFSIMKDQR